jgi:hypothetical protein
MTLVRIGIGSRRRRKKPFNLLIIVPPSQIAIQNSENLPRGIIERKSVFFCWSTEELVLIQNPNLPEHEKKVGELELRTSFPSDDFRLILRETEVSE